MPFANLGHYLDRQWPAKKFILIFLRLKMGQKNSLPMEGVDGFSVEEVKIFYFFISY
jgi:hypothetical protein